MTSIRTAYINARLLDPETNLDIKGELLTEGDIICDLGPKLFSENIPDSIEVSDSIKLS